MVWLWSWQNDFSTWAMQLHHSKDMSVHVSICTSYDELMPVVTLIRCASVPCHKNEWSLFRATNNIKFYAKLAKNAPHTCVMLSKVYGEEFKKKLCFEWQRAHVSKSQMKMMLITFVHIKCSVHFKFMPQGQTVNQMYYVEILKQLHEAVHGRRY